MSRFSIYLSVFLLTLLLMVTGCCRHYDERLEKIDRMLYAEPKEASRRLREFNAAVDTARLSKQDRHLHDLVAAFDRYISGISDTVNPALGRAAEYFERRKDWSKAGKSRFLLSVYQFRRAHYPEAIVEALRAAGGFSGAADSAWLARTYRHIGVIYSEMNDLASSAHYMERSRDIYKKIGDREYYPYVLMALAEILVKQEDYSNAIVIMNEVCKLGKVYNDTAVIACGYQQMLEATELMDSDRRALAYFDSLKNLGDKYVRSWDVESRGKAAYKVGDIKLVRICCDSIMDKDNTGELIQILQLHDGDYSGALDTSIKMAEFQNSQVVDIWQRNFASIINEYYESINREREREEQLHRYKMILILIGVSIIFVIFIISASIKIRRYNKEQKEMQADNAALKENIRVWMSQAEENKGIIRSYQEELDRLANELKEKNSAYDIALDKVGIAGQEALSRLTRGLNMELLKFIGDFDGLRNRNKSERIENMMNEFIDSLKSESSMKRCLSLANEAYGKVMDKFDRAFPTVSDTDRKIFLYSVLQFPVSLQIMILPLRDSTQHRNRKYQLKKLIEKSGHPESSFFSRLLSSKY